jgi:hypothetical protein
MSYGMNRGPTGYGATKTATGSDLRGVDPRMHAPKGHRQYQQFTPEQMDIFGRSQELVGPDSYLSRLANGDQSMFEQMEAPAWKLLGQAQQSLGNRYSQFAPGAMSAQRGSGHGQAQNQLSSDFAQDLASRRMGLQRQATLDLFNMSQELMGQRPYALQERQQKQQSGWGGLFGAGIGGLAGLTTRNPYWALQSAKLGYDVGSAF